MTTLKCLFKGIKRWYLYQTSPDVEWVDSSYTIKTSLGTEYQVVGYYQIGIYAIAFKTPNGRLLFVW